MRQTMLVGVLVFVFTALVSAQTHPCDQNAPTSVTVGSAAAHKVQFCAKPADAPEAFSVYVNGIASDLRPLTMVVAANAQGFALYEGPRELQFPTGSHQVQVSVWAPEFTGGPSRESAKSSPLSLTAVANNPPATAPKILGIIR
jgi:hypothetical protein